MVIYLSEKQCADAMIICVFCYIYIYICRYGDILMYSSHFGMTPDLSYENDLKRICKLATVHLFGISSKLQAMVVSQSQCLASSLQA